MNLGQSESENMEEKIAIRYSESFAKSSRAE